MRQNNIGFLLVFFWVSCSLGAQSPGEIQKKWWKESVFYQIYMPSYADSNGDGYGDFKGMTTKLDYLEKLGVKGIWLTPFLESPKVDNGYDISDYYKIDPTYGTREDFDRFLSEAHRRGIKVIMDLVLNHTSTDHFWFKESVKSKDNPYRDYYIWKDSPNNWESFFGGTAWEKHPKTHQFYYHKFDVRMADLNWQHPKVRAEVQEILRFWLKAGIDGFRLDVINFLNTDGILADNPMENGSQKHVFDIDQKGVKDAMRLIKNTVSEFPDKFIVGEIGSDKIEVLKQYQGEDLLDVVFNFNFGSIPEFSVERIFSELQSMEKEMWNYPTLFFGSHDMPRMMDRLADGNPEKATALAALILTAKGVPFVYYGEEIGMHNTVAEKLTEMVDIQGRTHYDLGIKKGLSPNAALEEANQHNRDKSRSPMQWNASAFAGFSERKTWLKIPSDYTEINVENAEKRESILSEYRQLIGVRNSEKVLQYGMYEVLESDGESIWFTRSFNGEKVSVVINFGKETMEEKLPPSSKILLGKTQIQPNRYLIYKH